MKNNIFKSLLLLAVVYLLPMSADAQKYIIQKTNGEKLELEYKDVASIIYGEANNGVYEFVDLGLSVKWATCNIGASVPEEYGNYYAWGEKTTKDSYDWANSITDEKEMLDFAGDPEYDVAAAECGGSVRMPTKDECEELVYGCTWTETTQNGVFGMLVTGSNGNSIFLPASGYYFGSQLLYTGQAGYFWSSTPYESDNYHAYHFAFYDKNSWYFYNYRGNGYPIRPVSVD